MYSVSIIAIEIKVETMREELLDVICLMYSENREKRCPGCLQKNGNNL